VKRVSNLFFKRSPSKDVVDLAVPESLGHLLSTSFSKEYRNALEIVREIRNEGNESEAKTFESQLVISFGSIQTFLLEISNQKSKELVLGHKLLLDANFVKAILSNDISDTSGKTEKIVKELEESCSYYADSVTAGKFIMMPNASLSQSQSYRSYLLGNSLNGQFNWGWETTNPNSLQKTDSNFTQIMGRLLTENFDLLNSNIRNKKTIAEIHNRSTTFVVRLSKLWESSTQRESLSLVK
jgi:hypothetical protein